MAGGVNDTIQYFLATGETDTAATTTFVFTADEINASGGTSKPIGVNVEDYSSKPNGTYEDEITYEVSVENTTTRTVTWTASDTWEVTDEEGIRSVTKDGVTVTAGSIAAKSHNILGGGTFTTNSGIFTKIEVTASNAGVSGDGWSDDGWSKKTWTGNAASVSFSGIIQDAGTGTLQIVFTIEE